MERVSGSTKTEGGRRTRRWWIGLLVVAVLIFMGTGIALVVVGMKHNQPKPPPSSTDVRRMGMTEHVRSDGKTKTVTKSDPYGNPAMAGVGDTGTNVTRFCNMSLSNQALNGAVDWWWPNDDTENFSLAPMNVITEANSGQSVLNISYYDDPSGKRVKGVYSALQAVGLPADQQCSIDGHEYCQFTASSSDPPQTYVFTAAPDGSGGTWKSAEGLLDCIDASNQIKMCENPYIPDNTPDCGCTEMSPCWSNVTTWACVLSCIIANIDNAAPAGA